MRESTITDYVTIGVVVVAWNIFLELCNLDFVTQMILALLAGMCAGDLHAIVRMQ